jgi:hypothetical protein
MDWLTLSSDWFSVILLPLTVLTATWALRGFNQSRQALKESASYVTLIVGALSPRIESLEFAASQLQKQVNDSDLRSKSLQDSESSLEVRCDGLFKSMQELSASYRGVIQDLEQLKSGLVSPQPRETMLPRNPQDQYVLDRLTPTERQALNHLSASPLSAPQIGRLLNKSREHTARLMRKLYLDGFVYRDSTRPPFTYRVNDNLRLTIGGSATTAQS